MIGISGSKIVAKDDVDSFDMAMARQSLMEQARMSRFGMGPIVEKKSFADIQTSEEEQQQ